MKLKADLAACVTLLPLRVSKPRENRIKKTENSFIKIYRPELRCSLNNYILVPLMQTFAITHQAAVWHC